MTAALAQAYRQHANQATHEAAQAHWVDRLPLLEEAEHHHRRAERVERLYGPFPGMCADLAEDNLRDPSGRGGDAG